MNLRDRAARQLSDVIEARKLLDSMYADYDRVCKYGPSDDNPNYRVASWVVTSLEGALEVIVREESELRQRIFYYDHGVSEALKSKEEAHDGERNSSV